MASARQARTLTPDVRRAVAPVLLVNGRMVPRRMLFLIGQHLQCPDGHDIQDPWRFIGDGQLYCGHRSHAGQRQCEAWMYARKIPRRVGEAELAYVIDATREELLEIEELALAPDGVLGYFGATFTR